MSDYNPHRIRIIRDVPQLRGIIPAGTELIFTTVNAICINGKCRGWDIHGLMPEAFEFVMPTATAAESAASSGEQPENPASVPPLAMPADDGEPFEIELPDFS